MTYTEDSFDEKTIKNVEEVYRIENPDTMDWLNIDGLHEVDIIETIGNHFDLHPLVMEDILNPGQRPKVEVYDNYIFIILKMLYFNEEKQEVTAEQVSIVLGKGFVISFQETVGDVFDSVRGRLRTPKTRVRRHGSDYLTYALMDAVVDNYFLVLEKFGEDIDDIEDELTAEPTQHTLEQIHKLKREVMYLRKSIWPLREVASSFDREESNLVKDHTHTYLRDLYDNIIQLIETIETYRDTLSGMVDLYLSSISNKMNQVMQVLTIIATIFIPLTFIAGIYGMNFQYMPELAHRWGYPMVILVMIMVTVVMLLYFRKKDWF